ncbi:FixH family protein [Falsiroseomonas oryziterrae]|uniref:FixH family protein n=1 Tax=Falsiroseomonas oryziterrae TaxID=2911368 RepID=UPI001F2AA59D|nr:FixH family protein [Roseomonas sp. NPKOSM-4]
MSDSTVHGTVDRGLDYDPNRSRWIPWAFVGAFAVIISVNMVLVYAALTTFTGVTTGKSYDRGRAYNEVLAEAARQDALGWQARVTLQDGVVSLLAHDREGLPLGGRVEGVLLRPLEGAELRLDFAAAGPGKFIAFADLPGRGQWEARLTLTNERGEHLDIRQRLIAP